MSEHTPSPQSVVVPVDDLAQEIRRVDGNHSLGAGALAEALLPFLSERLVAAPAPSSLAGGEVSVDRVMAVLNHWFDGTMRVDRNCEMVKQLAALSPEAPDRAGVWTYHERAIAEQVDDEESGFWRPCSGCQEGVDGYVSEKDYPYSKTFRCQPGGGCSECGGLGVLWDNIDYDQMAREMIAEEALTPRHEAPAEPVSDRYRFDDEIAWLREAARYFSVRDTKGEDRAHWANVYNAENARKLADRLAELSSNPCQLGAPAEGAGGREEIARIMQRNMIPDDDGGFSFHDLKAADQIMDYLRARSSAPEARDGEAVAWAIFWRHAMTLHATLEDAKTARKGVPHDIIPLYTHPAAPSADKLRIAVEALGPFANLGVTSGPDDEPCHYAYRITRGAIRNARQALAALKAEGA